MVFPEGINPSPQGIEDTTLPGGGSEQLRASCFTPNLGQLSAVHDALVLGHEPAHSLQLRPLSLFTRATVRVAIKGLQSGLWERLWLQSYRVIGSKSCGHSQCCYYGYCDRQQPQSTVNSYSSWFTIEAFFCDTARCQ